jgi:tRNA A-37 threonylcarbamoyl transferase component Bud32
MQRRKKQLDFYQSDKNIVIGDVKDLPISIEELIDVTADSAIVEKVFDSGLSAIVYKLKIGRDYYTLKKVREKILVENVDGQTSFLNEVQKRKILFECKKSNQDLYDGIVDTLYANFRKGIILSKWIEGNEVVFYNEAILNHLFKTMFAMMRAGIFENDPTTGNIVCKDDRITLFDFGYAYEMDPLKDINMEGFEAPVLHPAERFEARAFMIHLFDIEQIHGIEKACSLYRVEKRVASKQYKDYAKWVSDRKGNSRVVDYFDEIANTWDVALETSEDTLTLYQTEKFRSFLVDVIDDISGKSCTPDTLLKVEYVSSYLGNNYSQLLESGALQFEDMNTLGYSDLVEKFNDFKISVELYQLQNLDGFNEWKKFREKYVSEKY